jgi:hypothetical protein
MSEKDREKPEPRPLQIHLLPGESEEQAKARAALTSEYYAAGSIFQLSQILSSKDVDLTELANRLEYQTQQFKNGDLTQAESVLSSQAHTLDALFHHLLRRFALNIGNEFDVVDKLMKLALKAQSQCRTTLDCLAVMKKPPPELITQTNIAHGHQQVNNFSNKRSDENELMEQTQMEQTDGERLDGRATQEAVRGDQALETVDKKHRATNSSR